MAKCTNEFAFPVFYTPSLTQQNLQSGSSQSASSHGATRGLTNKLTTAITHTHIAQRKLLETRCCLESSFIMKRVRIARFIHNLRPRRPPFLRVLSCGIGVTSSTMESANTNCFQRCAHPERQPTAKSKSIKVLTIKQPIVWQNNCQHTRYPESIRSSLLNSHNTHRHHTHTRTHTTPRDSTTAKRRKTDFDKTTGICTTLLSFPLSCLQAANYLFDQFSCRLELKPEVQLGHRDQASWFYFHP